MRHRGGTTFLQFPHLARFDGLWHGIFTRHGGDSREPYHSLNVGLGIGDTPAAVGINRRRIQQLSEAPELVFANQVHGRQVLVLTEGQSRFGPRPAVPSPGAALTGDALVTDEPGRYLVIQVADCQPVLLYDPVRRVAANVHCGWRGSIQNIVGRTIGTLQSRFGCRPGDIRAGIGPSLGPCCAEFVHYRTEIPEAYWCYRVGPCHFDFWAMTGDQLRAAGVAKRNILTSRICTRCHPDDFFSYRGEKKTGRFAAVIGLRIAGTESPQHRQQS